MKNYNQFSKRFVLIDGLLETRLESDKTEIYINNNKFMSCKYLLINVPTKLEVYTRDIISIDEAKEYYSNKHEGGTDIGITPLEEFNAHNSNLMAWIEHNYAPNLLASNLAIPLLKELIIYDIDVFMNLLYYLDKMYVDYSEVYDKEFTLQRRLILLEQYREIVEHAIKQYDISLDYQDLSVFVRAFKLVDMLCKMYHSKIPSFFCQVCEKYQYTQEFYDIDIYNPYDDEPNETYHICQSCADNGFPCDSELAESCGTCYRYIYTSHYRTNFVYVEEWCEMTCVKCFNEIVLDDGLPEFKHYEYLEELTIETIEKNGFAFQKSYKLEVKSEWKEIEQDFDDLKESGYKVIVKVLSGSLHHYRNRTSELELWIKK